MMELVNGKDDIPYMENNPFMFETTNQINIDPEHHQFLVETNRFTNPYLAGFLLIY